MIFGIQAGSIALLGTQVHSLSDIFLALGSRMQTVSAQEVGCALATQNLTASQYAQMTSALSLEGETASLTVAKVEEAAATAGLTSSQTSAIASTLGLGTAQKSLALTAIGAKASVLALNAALGLGLGIVIMGISKLLTVAANKIKEITHRNELLKESIDDLNTEAQEAETDLQKLNDQLDEVREKLKDLNDIGSLDVTNETATIELQKQNDLLEAQIALKERELELINTEKNQTIEDWYNETWNTEAHGTTVTEEIDGAVVQYVKPQTEEEYFQQQILRAEELYNKQQRLNERTASLSKSDIAAMTTEQMAALQLSEDEQAELLEIQKYITDITGELNQQISGYDAVTDEQNATLNKWNSIIIKASQFASFELWNRRNSPEPIKQTDDTIQSLSDHLKNASEDIDDYQSRINTLMTAINGDMSSTELIDLMRQVSEWNVDFDWEEFGVTGERGIGDLNGALNELNEIITKQIHDKYPELSAQLNSIAKSSVISASGFDTLSNALQTLSSHHSLLDNVAESIKDTGVISVEAGDEIIAAYPQMKSAFLDYLMGIKSADDVYTDLEGLYKNDLDLYYQLILQKKEMDYSFYVQVYDNLPLWVQSHLTAYQKDFGNFKNLAEAKIRLQEQFLKLEEMSALNSTDNTYLNYARQNINAQKDKLQDILTIINATELDVGGIKEPVFNRGSESGGSNDSSSIQQIDWAASSLDNISRRIDYLDKALENSDSFKQRASYLTQLIASQNLYNDSLEKQSKLYQHEYLNAIKTIPQYRKLIESGAIFKIEEFVNQDELYEAITRAQDLYASWQDITTAQEDAKKSLRGYKNQLSENSIGHLVSEIQLIQNEIDGIESAIDITPEFSVIGNERKIINSWKKERYVELLNLSTEMQELLQQKLINYQSQLQGVQPDTDKYYELQDNVAEVQQSLNDCAKAQREYNTAILSLPLEQYQKQLDLLDKNIDILSKVKDKYSDYISAVTYSIDEEIDSITNSKDGLTEYYDGLIRPVQQQLDALQETNDERERALGLQKAYYDLENAQNNLSVKTYVDGQGFVYRPDENAMRNAQDALDSALYDKAVNELQKQITSYEKTRDTLLEDYDKELDRLSDLKDSWSDIITRIESLALINEFKLQFGDSAITRIIDGTDTSTIRNITQWVTEVQAELDSLNAEKQNLEDVVNTLQLVVDSYEDGSIDVDAAMTRIDQVVAEHTRAITDLNQKHVESVLELSNEYKKSIATFGDAEGELSEDTEDNNDKMRTVIARACLKIKDAYNNLSNFMSSFKSDMISNIRDIGDAAAEMADDIASSAESANRALSSIDTSAPAQQTTTSQTSSSESQKVTSIGGAVIAGISTVIGLLFKHDGIESGLVAKDRSEVNRDSIFKRIALDDLKANEVPAVLQVGEAVLTKKQQNNVIRNMVTGVDYGMRFAQGVNKTSNVNVNIPEIHVHEVQNADALAREITKSFKTRMIQEVRK